ncbi:UbiH/UbiF family hydroxylase [Phaeovulum vinaykumarii]|uniref:2-octaprenyl-6-methoxyphenol hydroxylase n=1 Tax=Phaeovulum vinaykumarii TaxID=407234 RepID=A0A1N7JJ96_9RHOB|nr:UbiH/UbiF family hydroxylase [Phaeovulum vinaykumarii]SIS49397.1 2-octaprenyl-6-methoxyphenol hydroxylase [Phaeovulum vinaykumarii]SOB89679.1 2-octaprenyl-6-methoxyphenol hydroxylase [Phaeovulum vinaykumarii]
MSEHSTDILIAGGGPAGLIAAAAFGAEGYRVTCVDPAPPVTDETASGADMRTSALLQPSVRLLERAGIWDSLAPHGAALSTMRILDAGKGCARERPHPLMHDFKAEDISDQPFGWNFPNWAIRREALARIERLPNVRFLPGRAVEGVVARDDTALARLDDGTRLSAQLVVGADGRNSPLREGLGIRTRRISYGQKALAFAVTHPSPHENISTEIHASGGPFTLVPLPDRAGSPSSAVVWMEKGPEAERLAALPLPDFEAALNARAFEALGPLRVATRIAVWPIISQIALGFTGPRVALMAEAAHVVPPIGAQGLNMSLADLACLIELANRNRAELGNPAMLTAYQRRRWPEVAARIAAVDALNRTSMAGTPPVQIFRAGLLDMIHRIPTLRKGLMRVGLGAGV